MKLYVIQYLNFKLCRWPFNHHEGDTVVIIHLNTLIYKWSRVQTSLDTHREVCHKKDQKWSRDHTRLGHIHLSQNSIFSSNTNIDNNWVTVFVDNHLFDTIRIVIEVTMACNALNILNF